MPDRNFSLPAPATTPAPCEPWCAHHDLCGGGGEDEQWCISEARELRPVSPHAPLVRVDVSRYQIRDDESWTAQPVKVYLEVGGTGVELLPHEAVQLAQLLLGAHGMGDGVTAAWAA